MPVDDAAHAGQPDPVALELLGRVQALEDAKQLVHVAHVETDAVVPYEEHHLSGMGRLALHGGGMMNAVPFRSRQQLRSRRLC